MLTQLVASIELSRFGWFVFIYKYMCEQHNGSNMIYECHYDKHYHHSRFTIQKAPISMKEKKLDGSEKHKKK